ncbi:unnamed protein product [Durusdinium trenchii]|uniref:Kinesin motor domain-containing protein n=1 Tax=Durusdinium trenchii TaxID=1381693 RepID=A0ABP0QL85_9DINO
MDPSEAIRIGVRLRPLVPCEAGQSHCLKVRDNVIMIDDGGKAPKEFAFDYVMDSTNARSVDFVSQERCYQLMAEKMVEHALQGYSTCLFCYGQTGTGKTTTILGKSKPSSEQGLLLRLVADLFQQVKVLADQGNHAQCRVQIVEVHNEKVRDLLTETPVPTSPTPEVHVHPQLGVYLKHVLDQPVHSLEACLKLIDEASNRQTVAPTAMNARSSRGHTVYKLSVEKHGSDNTVMTSEVYFVDLAGRENERSTKVSGDRLVELSFINRSLMWLSQCIYALGGERTRRTSRLNSLELARTALTGPRGSADSNEGSRVVKRDKGQVEKRTSIDRSKMSSRSSTISEDSDDRRGSKGAESTARFRNSKLTLLLAKALSGNSKTSVICTLSPAKANAEESYTTLNFAASLKNVKVFAKPATRIDKDSLISGLQAELHELREKLAADNSLELSSRLEVANGLLETYRESWQQKIEENHQLREQCNSALKRLGLAKFRVAAREHSSPSPKEHHSWSSSSGPSQDLRERRPSCPHLASYSDDPDTSGQSFFPIMEKGLEYCLGCAPECHFVLPRSNGISPQCAFLWLEEDRLFLRPAMSGGTVVEVNHTRLRGDERRELFHGDFLVLGSSVCFFVSLETSGFATGGVGSGASRVQKLPTWWSLGPKERSKMMQEILESDSSHQLQVALHYMSVLQGQNLDSAGFQSLDQFLRSAQRAARLVSEANALTDALKPLSNLKLELSSIAPVMLYGYGDNFAIPDLCVRLIKRSRTSEVESLSIWTLPQFEVRLKMMRELHEKRLQNPDTFALEMRRLQPWESVELADTRTTSTLAQDAERLFVKMDHLLAQQTSASGKGLKESKLGEGRQREQIVKKQTPAFAIAGPRSRSLGRRSQVEDSFQIDQLADASTSFSSSGHIPEADSAVVVHELLGDASPSFSSASSWSKAGRGERDASGTVPCWVTTYSRNPKIPGTSTAPVPAPNMGRTAHLPSSARGTSSLSPPRMKWFTRSSVPVAGEIGQASVQSTPGFPLSNAQDQQTIGRIGSSDPGPRAAGRGRAE